ncbi:MAG: hypothetical protein ABJF11_04180 [Reichenbachiella sp.]|uniref:hypothetical protein n=1 Tax=Reichenbachiella sp. TaxID=2184521 RepID=UPI0032666C20
MNQDAALEYCKIEIESVLNWGPSAQWENQEFEELSHAIFKKTGVNLSHTTLKRVWGKVKYDNRPSISTLDALVNFLDYSSWSAFKRAKENVKSATSKSIISSDMVRSRRFALSLVLVILVSFGSWYIITSNITTSPQLGENLKFEAKYSSFGLPNTVIFSFDASGLSAEECVIQQSWDRTKRIPVTTDQKKATSVYYYPGYFRSKFVADEIVLKEADVYIETQGWQATINTEPLPVYLSDKDLIKTNHLRLSENGLKHLGRHYKPVSFHYYKREENILGSDFEFETAIRYAMANRVSACKYAKVVLHFSEGVFLIPLVIPGCVGEANLIVMDNFISGKSNDLSAFGVSLQDWQKINVSATDNRLSIDLAGQPIYTASFKMDPGHLVGISYQFDGAGEIDYLRLSNGNTTWEFDESYYEVEESATTGSLSSQSK